MQNLTQAVIAAAEEQAQAMLATADCTFDDAFTFAPAIHDFVRQAVDLGPEGASYRSDLLRAALMEQGGFAPEGDFVFYGGACIPTPSLFLSDEERRADAEQLARAIVDASNTAEKAADGEPQDILCATASLDDEELGYYSQAFERLYKERYGEDSFVWPGETMALLSDGTFQSLQFIFANDDFEEKDEGTGE